MKITICGSMKFAKEMLEAQKSLEQLEHEAIVPIDTQACFENPDLKLNESLEHCAQFSGGIDKDHFDKIADSDAILVLNYPKHGMDGYVGGATLMEIGIARHLNKKIFLLYDVPADEVLRYSLEIRLTNPVILEGDIQRINEFLDR